MAPDGDPDLLDCRGLKCPLPVLKLEKRLAALAPGGRLTLLASDPVAAIDVPLYCHQHDHGCVSGAEGALLRFEIVKRGTDGPDGR